MPVVVVGLHERDVALDLLARVAIADHDLAKALAELCDSPHIAEAVVLSTCMRTEVYAVTERFHEGIADIETFFEGRIGEVLGGRPLAEQLFVAYDDAAAQHLFEVAAGLDSAVLGEGEVLRQVRHAAERAGHERAAGPILGGMFRHAVEVGKRARSETAISRGITSLSHVAVALAAEHCGGDLAGRKVSVIGAGEMGSGIAEALSSAPGSPEVVIANRRLDRARALAEQYGSTAISLASISQELESLDVVISAVVSDQPVLTLEALRAARGRVDRPLLVIDAAVPRSVEASIAYLEGVELLDLDDMRRYAESQMEARRGEVEGVEVIVAEELERFRVNVRNREVAPLVAALRSRGEQFLTAELERAKPRIDRLSDEDGELVAEVARRVVAKLLHTPTVQLKQAAGSARGERLSEALRSLFDL